MKSKPRVKKAFHFDTPDKIPKSRMSLFTDFFAFPTLVPKEFQPTEYPPHFDLNKYKSRFARWFILKYKWKKKHRKKLGLPKKWWNYEPEGYILTIDEWGVIWRHGGAHRDFTMGHPYKGPFQESWNPIDEYEIPDPTISSRYRFWNFIAKRLGWRKYLVGSLWGPGLFHLSSYLRGFNNLLIDFIRNPERVHQLINMISEFFYVQIEQLKEKCPKLDAIMVLDDLGSQKSPFMSPKIFRKFYYDSYKKMIELTHELGMDFILHSCGQIKELLPILHELGVDVLEFDSPNMTGVENFKKYAQEQEMAFWLSPDIQTTYSNGTPKDVEEEVKYFIREIADNQGGMAFYEYLDRHTLGVPKENIRAYHRIQRKYGKYNDQGRISWLT